MNSEEYLNYLQESQHIAIESYNHIGELYIDYINHKRYEEYIQEIRDEKIDDILK